MQAGASSRPKKADIDQMHAYRDALHTPGQREVVYAAILYPGSSMVYDHGRLAAVQALPQAPLSDSEGVGQDVAQVLRSILETL